MNKIIKLSLFVIGILLLVILVYKSGLSEIFQVVKKAKLHFLITGVFVYLGVVFFRSLKWFLLLKATENKIEYKKFLPLYLVNSLLGNMTPYKSGQAVTPFLFKKYLKIPVGQGFSVIILDGFFELTVFLFYLFFAILYMLKAISPNSFISLIFQQIFIVLAMFIFIIFLILFSKKFTLKIISFFAFLKKYSLPEKILEFIEKELDIFYKALSVFKNKKIIQIIIFLTFLAWFLEIVSFYFVFGSVFKIASFFDIAASQIIAAAVTFITFIPGGLGIAEVSVVYLLGLIRYSSILTTSGVLLNRFFLSGTLLTLGLIGLLFIKEKKGNSTLD